jgi:fluoride exporter
MDGRALAVVLAIAAGGGLGAVARHFVNTGVGLLLGTEFPWGILVINISGSFLIGALTETFALAWDTDQVTRAFLTTGICGGYTTFSTFSLDSVMLAGRGQIAAMASYIFASLFLSIVALYGGLYLIRSVVGPPTTVSISTAYQSHTDHKQQSSKQAGEIDVMLCQAEERKMIENHRAHHLPRNDKGNDSSRT